LLRAAALVAALGHLAARASFVHAGRFFACEDDAYRSYSAYLVAGGGEIIGRFWLPGHIVAMAAAQKLGVPAVWSGPLIATLAVIALAAAVADAARSLAPDDLRPAAPWAALFLVAASPMTLVLGASALAEPLECALVTIAAAAVLRRARGGPRRLLVPAVIALLAATWVRYEAWAVALTLPGVLYLVRRYAGDGPRAAAREAAIGAIPLLGPIAWLSAQSIRYHDPFAFVHQVDHMSLELTGEPSTIAVLGHRASSIARWAPATLACAALALWALRSHRRHRDGAVMLFAVTTLGIAIAIAGGREHAVFVDRLAYGIEAALWPLAALGLAWAATRRLPAAIAIAVPALAALAFGVTRPPEIMDAASPRAGLMLRREGLAAEIGPGALLVERVPQRPPFGWAALGVLWGRWDRVVFAQRRVNRWEMVRPASLQRTGRETVILSDLRGWLAEHQVTAAWVLTPGSVEALADAWPSARVRRIGAGLLVVKE
jgi:hypothetical protein